MHGAFHGAWCWNAHFVDFFATRGFHVVAPSLRGHGSSQRDGPLRLRSIADFVADVAQIANSLASEPILVGHSMGGFIVQKYLERYSAPAGVLLASAPPTRTPTYFAAFAATTPVVLGEVRHHRPARAPQRFGGGRP
ncbi:alpha/beta hydrolase [Mycobacterium kubicae]|uniref:alpha/beta hydrolase n=1 Tax=Mycobacterium kubicae TaxID=120959 RepID=UPI001F61926E|nr:alpha/beta fold hydrolase [Mycobacterium kubicae]